jgi:septum site-determining protein MinC
MAVMRMHDLINIKGGKDGLRILIDETSDWSSVLTALQAQFDQAGNFFAGAYMIVEVGNRRVDEQQLVEMLTLMQTYGLAPESLATTMRESRDAARAVGLTTRAMPRPVVQPSLPVESESTLLYRTVRSGQVVRHQGHIILIGDVNPGAQLIAGGTIIVWGRLRGLVHAGALGDREALVCALDLRPTQLRIANLIARAPEEMSSNPPEVARIEQDTIVVESWDVYKRV